MHWRARWWFLIVYILFHPYFRKWSNLTNIFQMAWNHQLACICLYMITIWSLVWPNLYMLFVSVDNYCWMGKVRRQSWPAWEVYEKWTREMSKRPPQRFESRFYFIFKIRKIANCNLMVWLSLYFQTCDCNISGLTPELGQKRHDDYFKG